MVLALRGLNKLEQLYLDYSSINTSFLLKAGVIKAGVMTSLKVLSISGCGLNGSLPAQGSVSFQPYGCG